MELICQKVDIQDSRCSLQCHRVQLQFWPFILAPGVANMPGCGGANEAEEQRADCLGVQPGGGSSSNL